MECPCRPGQDRILMYAAERISEPIASQRSWPPALRFGFRVTFVYIALYLLPQWLFLIPRWLYWIPALASVGRGYEAAWQWIELWVARHVLAIASPIDLHTLGTGSGDTLLNYLQLLCQSTVAALAALIWTAI